MLMSMKTTPSEFMKIPSSLLYYSIYFLLWPFMRLWKAFGGHLSRASILLKYTSAFFKLFLGYGIYLIVTVTFPNILPCH